MKKKYINKSILAFLIASLNIMSLMAAHDYEDFEGDGSTATPFLIQSADDLVLLSASGIIPWKNYKLANDIDMSGQTFYGIGPDPNGGGQARINFDGDSNVVYNLTITANGANPVGFISSLWQESSVHNLGIYGLTIYAPEAQGVGGIAGDYGTWAGNRIKNCFVSKANITGLTDAGGIVGRGRGGSITDCYVNGNITSVNNDAPTGGIVGRADEWGAGLTPLTNVMFYGNVSNGNSTNANAIAGVTNTPAVSGAYYDDNANVTDAIGTAVSALEDQASYSGFDFASIWMIQTDVGAVLNYTPPWFAAVAIASDDQEAKEGDIVTVHGISSTPSADGTSVQYFWSTAPGYPTLSFSYREFQYQWVIEGGRVITADTILYDSATFTVPGGFPRDTTLMILLQVVDDFGNASPENDTVLINVRTAADNITPVADAGEDQTVHYGRPVTLTGTGSDGDGDGISFNWTVPDIIEIADASSPTISFTAPTSISHDTTFTFILNTIDSAFSASSENDTAYLTVNTNVAPTGSVSASSTSVLETDHVVLEAINAFDVNGDKVFYSWIVPEGITLSDTAIPKPSFTAPNVNSATTFTLSLILNDGLLESTMSDVSITVNPNPDRTYPPAATVGAELSNISIYPNPSSGLFTLEISDAAQISISNILGKKVHEQMVFPGENSFDLSVHGKGLYIISISNNKTIITHKVQVK